MNQPETGSIMINRHRLSWKMKRSKGESCFGIRGSRIFALELAKDGTVTGLYDRGWEKQIPAEDEESALALSHILNTYGKEKKKKEKEKG